MKTIFEASSGLEAYMILNLLQQQGIECRVDGEYLQGGVGELQAMNIVRVLVAEDDYEKAQTVLKEWESTQVDFIDDRTSTRMGSGVIPGLLFGLLVGAGVTIWAYNSPVTSSGIDYNDDGKLEEEWVYRDSRITRVNLDRNRDGEIDAINYYSLRGLIYKSESDDNFDGIYETTYKYKRGNVESQESDLTQDGVIDYYAYFNNGMLYKIEITGPLLSSPRKRQIYNMNKLVSAEFDSDGDGLYDVSYEYDFYEEIESKITKPR